MGYRHYFYSIDKIKRFELKKTEELRKEFGEYDGENTHVSVIFITEAFNGIVFEFGKYWEKSVDMEKSCTQYFVEKETHEYFQQDEMILKANKNTIKIAIDYFETWNNVEGDEYAGYFNYLLEEFDWEKEDLIFCAY